MITLLRKQCVKIWACYPLTDNNWKLWKEHHDSPTSFIDLQGQLEYGEFILQTAPEAIYMPPACLHATITLKGGMATGINFSTIKSMDTAWKLLELENQPLTRAEPQDLQPLADAILVVLESGLVDHEEALKYLCRLLPLLKGTQLNTFTEKFERNSKCRSCGKLWKHHRPGSRQQL